MPQWVLDLLTGLATAALGGVIWNSWLTYRRVASMSDHIGVIKACVQAIRKESSDIHEWHDKEDSDGVKVWYVRHSLAQAMENIAVALGSFKAIREQETALLGKIAKQLERIERNQQPKG